MLQKKRLLEIKQPEQNLLHDQQGFTLLETMIAMAIMMVAFASILMVESASINTAVKTKQMNIVNLLARRAMIEAEHEFTGKKFEEIQKEKSEQVKPPYENFKMTRTIKEIKFPSFNMQPSEGGSNPEGSQETGNNFAEQLTKLVTNFLSKAVREVTVTISWKKGEGEQKFSVSTYWVDLNHDFALSD